MLTQEEAKKMDSYHCYDNGDWEYKDEKEYWHLYRNGEELTKNIKAVHCFSYANGDWEFEEENKYWHLYRNGEELTKNIKAVNCASHPNGDWEYEDEAGIVHEKSKEGIYNRLTQEEGKKLDSYFDYINGDWGYRDWTNLFHLYRNGEELTKNIKAVYCFSYANGDWEYWDENGYYHLIRKGGIINMQLPYNFTERLKLLDLLEEERDLIAFIDIAENNISGYKKNLLQAEEDLKIVRDKLQKL